MRLDKLSLIAYRGLAGVELAFRADAKLHLVHGPNASGKSTALAAIADALYGFPRQGDHTAMHAAKDLRIGVELSSGHKSLHFERLKKDRDDLVEPGGTGLVASALLEGHLGVVDRRMFETQFGLSAGALRAGVEEMLDPDEDGSAALFSASTGLHGLRRMSDGLDAEADGLFAPRKAAKRLFYQQQSTFLEHEKRAKESRLTGAGWKALLAEIGAAENEAAELAQERIRMDREIRQLEYLERVHPLHADIRAIELALEEFGDLDGFAQGKWKELQRLADEALRATDELAAASEQLEEAGASLRGLGERDPILDERDRVSALVREVERVRAFDTDVPRVEALVVALDRQLDDAARGIGFADFATMDAERPTQIVLSELTLSLQAADDRDAARKLAQARIEEPDEADDGYTPALDPAPARRVLEALEGPLARVARLRELREALRADEAALAREGASLDPAVEDARAIELPGSSASKAILARLNDVQASLDDVQRRLNDLEARRRDVEAQRAALLDEGDLVTREQIESARATRDGALHTGGGELAKLIGRADDLADRAFERASQVAELARLEAEAAALDAAVTEAAAERDERARDRDRTRDELAAAFAPFDVSGLSGSELLVWRGEVEGLRGKASALAARRREVEALATERDGLTAPLREVARLLDEDGEALDGEALVRFVGGAMERAEAAWRAAEKERAVTEERERRHAEARRRIATLDEEEAGWRAPFAALCVQVGLREGATPAQARLAMGTWEQVATLRADREDKQARIDGMRRERAAFTARFEALAVVLGEPADEPLEAIERLDRRLERARTVQAQQVEREAVEAAARASWERARLRLDEAAARRDAAVDALADTEEGVAEALDRLRRRDEHLEARSQAADAIARVPLGAGWDWDEDARASAQDAYDPAEGAARLNELRGELEALDERIAEANATLRVKTRERETIEAAGGSEVHAFAANAARAEMVETGRDWLVRRTAAHLLRRTVELHAEQTSGAFLTRVGELLASLTEGAYVGVRQDFTGHDGPRLVVEPAGLPDDAEPLPIFRLSSGVRDQLYLALRLANLEAFGRSNAAMPFIGDDIFTEFDPARTRAGLRTLAGMADAFQAIVFTHHAFVRDLAVEALGADVDVIEL